MFRGEYVTNTNGSSLRERGRILVGGGNMDMLGESYRWIADQTGRKGTLLVITLATDIAETRMNSHRRVLGSNVGQILELGRKDSEKEALEKAGHASVIIFTGGDQAKISKYMFASVRRLIKKRWHKKEIDIAGFSAGAMYQSTQYIRGSSDGSTKLFSGLGTVESKIDTHLDVARQERLAQVGGGIGLPENVSILIEEGRSTVVGDHGDSVEAKVIYSYQDKPRMESYPIGSHVPLAHDLFHQLNSR